MCESFRFGKLEENEIQLYIWEQFDENFHVRVVKSSQPAASRASNPKPDIRWNEKFII